MQIKLTISVNHDLDPSREIEWNLYVKMLILWHYSHYQLSKRRSTIQEGKIK